MNIGGHRNSKTGRSNADRMNRREKRWGSKGFLWESAVFAAVFTILICIYLYMQTGGMELKIAVISFAGMFSGCIILLGGIRRSVEKRLASLEDDENDPEAAEDEEYPDG